MQNVSLHHGYVTRNTSAELQLDCLDWRAFVCNSEPWQKECDRYLASGTVISHLMTGNERYFTT